jgi:hypothetical protein
VKFIDPKTSDKNVNTNMENERHYSNNKNIFSSKNINIYNNTEINDTKQIRQKTRIRTLKRTKTLFNKKKYTNRHSKLTFQFNHIVSKIDYILNDLNYLNSRKRNVNELKIKLSRIEVYDEDRDKEKIENNIKMLDFLKKENIRLKNKINKLMESHYNNDEFKNILEKKLILILNNIDKKINIQEKLNMKNIFDILKRDSTEFLKKFHISKILYLIKIIEFVLIFLYDVKNRYLSNPKTEKIVKSISDKIEKDKYLLMHEMMKEQIKQDLEEKKMKILEKATKIRFHSKHKFYMPSNKRLTKSHSNKKNIKRNVSNDIFDQWITYD